MFFQKMIEAIILTQLVSGGRIDTDNDPSATGGGSSPKTKTLPFVFWACTRVVKRFLECSSRFGWDELLEILAAVCMASG